MRRLGTWLDPHLVAALLIALSAALPFLTRPGLPRHTDLELHVFRAAEFQARLADRPLEYPRWAPDFYYGYGYPIFNYYAPLTYYAASLFATLPGLGIVDGMKGVLLLTFGLAALGAFLFARRHFGSAGGVTASAAYVLSPYLVFIDPFMRGDAAEFLGLGLLPWVFLAFDRPLLAPRDVGRAALTLAALVFSHNLMALIGAALLAAWLLWRGLLVDGVRRWPRDLAAIGLAGGLTALFWLPFLAEREAVRLDVAGPGHFDFRNHFVEIAALLRLSPVLDLGATTPHFIYNLGLPQWVLALAALPALRRLSLPASRVAAFFGGASLLLVFAITPVSALAWVAIPPASIIQFPWRFLGPAAFTLAMCAGCALSAFSRLAGQPANRLPAFALAAFLLFALPTLYPPLWDAEFGDTSPQGMIEFELSGVALGTTSTSDFLPRSVAQLPSPAQSLIDSYRAARVDRFDYASASGARVEPIRLGALDVEYAVEAATGFIARFYVFAFPGWQALVDGQLIPIRPPGSDGFISFDVPPSARSFGLRFESTPPRTLGAIVSLASALAIVLLAAKPILCGKAPKSPNHSNFQLPTSNLQYPIILATFLLIKFLVFDRCDTCFRYTSPPGQALAATTEQPANFGNHIALLGFDIHRPEVQPGQVIPLTLYWKAVAPAPVNYQVFAHLTRPPFVLWGQSDKLNPGDFPTTRWPLDKYVWDDHALRVLPGTPPGEYAVVVGLYTLADGRRAPVLDAAGRIVGDSVQLSLPVRVVRASSPPSIESLNVQLPLQRREEDLLLLGASIEQTRLSRPNFARLTLFWKALAGAPANRIVRAQLLDPHGSVASEIVSSPADGAYPTSAWQAGEVVRDIYAFWLPPDFPPGHYDLRVNLEDEQGRVMQRIALGQVEVTDT